MAKESFMLISLNEDKAKKLAQVISNPTCTKILNYLAGKDATESQIAKDMHIPLSTVHYNLQQLVDAKLVVAEEFHYSEKGREVNHYKLANKYIIIAPAEDTSFLQHIKKYIPAATIVVAVGAALKTLQFFTKTTPMPEAAPMMMQIADEVPPEASRKMGEVVVEAGTEQVADGAADASMQMFAAAPADIPVEHWWQTPVIDYFIAGALFVLFVILIIEALNYWRERRK